jgi:hypothetical protein
MKNKIEKLEEIIKYVETWLNDNIDENYQETLAEDAANLLQKINEMKEKINE